MSHMHNEHDIVCDDVSRDVNSDIPQIVVN